MYFQIEPTEFIYRIESLEESLSEIEDLDLRNNLSDLLALKAQLSLDENNILVRAKIRF